ncbi:MAG: acyl-[acyl-carrier-protein]--UDP-N-acetylglucosamine O-acyltransferase, partial [Lentisphaerae bacterium]|nr:acyl-[acyl-carrier-protein]--UDP-N-acetylglucosamine O-acyltransferase [Lentisphaerota bacterium]
MTRVHPTAIVDKDARLGEDVEIGAYSMVVAHVNIGAGTRVKSHVVLDGCLTIGAGCTIFPFASLGSQTQDLKFKGART